MRRGRRSLCTGSHTPQSAQECSLRGRDLGISRSAWHVTLPVWLGQPFGNACRAVSCVVTNSLPP